MPWITLPGDSSRLTDDEIIVYRDDTRETRRLVPYRRTKTGEKIKVDAKHGSNIRLHVADQPEGSSDEERSRIRREWVDYLNIRG